MIIDVEDFGNTYVPDPFIEDQIPLPFFDDDDDFSDCSLNDRINQKLEDWGID